MFTSKGSDVSLNSQRRSNTNPVKLKGLSVTTNEHNAVRRGAGLQNSSSSHVENQLRNVATPIVSVISSSMDIFGSGQPSNPRTVNTVDSSTTTSYPISANVAAPSFTSEPSKYGITSTQFAAGTKSEKSEPATSTKPKSVKRGNNNDAASIGKIQKKSKPAFEVEGEKSNHSGNQNGIEKNAIDMSFERAAVVAALSTLYGASNEKLSSKLPTSTNTPKFVDTEVPMPLPKQVKSAVSQIAHKVPLPCSGDEMVKKSVKAKALINTVGVHAAAHSLAPSLLGPRKHAPEETENSTAKMGSHLSKKKVSKADDSSTNARTSTYTQYPSQYDVLLGRGKSNKNHPGNVWFQGMFTICSHCKVRDEFQQICNFLLLIECPLVDYIQANRDRYFNAPTNVQKRQITMEILETIRKKGRFLRRGAQGWVDVSTVDVQQKVAHALQYRRRCELREHTSTDSTNPHISTISHPPPRTGSDSDSGENVQNIAAGSNFDANAIALAMVNTAGNYSMARLDAQTRQEQYKVNQEYYQNYLSNLQRSSVGVNRNDIRIKSDVDDAIIGGLQQSQHPLHALAVSHAQRLNQPRSLHSSGVSTIPDTSSTISNILLRRLSNIDYRNNAMLNSIGGITNLNPTSLTHIVDASSTADEQQSSAPSSENLDSSGLHSLADVISHLYSQEETDVTHPRGHV
jgi:hypothetical protein